jgi:hypothetical protein
VLISTQVSWAYHPFHGVYLETGYHTHTSIRKQCPDLYETDEHGNYAEYNPITGWAKIELNGKTIQIGSYEWSNVSKYLEPVVNKICQRYQLVGYKGNVWYEGRKSGPP